jgi:SAM-dependent methyltransferase
MTLVRPPCCFCRCGKFHLVNQQGPRCLAGDFKHLQGFIKNLVCAQCGLMVNPFPLEHGELASFYDAYTKKSETEEEDDLLFSADARSVETLTHHQMQFLVHNLDLPEHGKILDVGCGKGALLEAFRGHRPAWTLHGIDPSEQEVALARRKSYLHVRKGFFGQDDPGADRFDVITMTHVLEHVPDPHAALLHIGALLADDGHAFIEVPNPLDLNMFYDFLLYEHVYHFSPDTLIDMLLDCGLEPVLMHPHTSYGAQRIIVRKRAASRIGPRPGTSGLASIWQGLNQWHAYWDEVLALSMRSAAEVARGRRLALFGAGMTSAVLLTYTCLAETPILGLFDESPYKIGKTMLGQPIHSLAALETIKPDVLLLATIPSSQDLVLAKLQHLRGQGIAVERLPMLPRAQAPAA